MSNVTAERPNVYRLMADAVLDVAILDLERAVAQLPHLREPAPAALRDAYQTALDRARCESLRRRTI